MLDLARNLKTETVARLRPTAPLTIRPAASIAEAIKLMRQKQVGCLLVCDGRKLCGIFTERDLLTRVLAPGRPTSDPVGEVMTTNPVTVGLTDSIRRAVLRMEKVTP